MKNFPIFVIHTPERSANRPEPSMFHEKKVENVFAIGNINDPDEVARTFSSIIEKISRAH